MNLFLFSVGLWIAISFLYVFKSRKALGLYFLSIPAFPFFWAPFYVAPFNALSVQRFIAIGIVGGMIIRMSIDVQKSKLDKLGFSASYFLFIICIMWYLSIFQISTMSNGIRMIIFAIVDYWFPFYLGMVVAKNGKGVKYLLNWIVWPSILLAVIIFYEYIVQTPIVHNWFMSLKNYAGTSEAFKGYAPSFLSGVLRVKGTMAHAIFAGFYLSNAALMAFILSRIEIGNKKIFYFIGGGFLLLCSILTMARSAMVGFIVAALFLIILNKKISRWKIILGGSIIFILMWISSSFLSGVKSYWIDFLMTLTGRASSNVQSNQLMNWEGRLEVLQQGYQLLLKAPLLGYGDISFSGAWLIRDVVNVFVQVSLQSGIVGIILFLSFIIVIIIQCVKLWKLKKEKSENALAVGLIGCFIIVIASWIGSSWPGQFTQIGFLIMGIINRWANSDIPIVV